MRVEITTALAAPPERIWQELRRTELLEHVAAPILRFEPIQPETLPETWEEGRYLVALRFLGVLPMGRQWIVTSFHPDDTRAGHFALRDNGSGQLVSRWDHWIFLEPDGAGGTRYTDRVEVEAGLLTPFIWLFAQMFYRHRQSRWRALVARDFQYEDG